MNSGKFDTSKFTLKEDPVRWNPDGITEIKYYKNTDLQKAEKIKSIAPRGTTQEDFIEAGALLKKDYLNGNVATYQIPSTSSAYDPSLNQFIFSKTQYSINGKLYYVQGYRTIVTPGNSSWWFVETIPSDFN